MVYISLVVFFEIRISIHQPVQWDIYKKFFFGKHASFFVDTVLDLSQTLQHGFFSDLLLNAMFSYRIWKPNHQPGGIPNVGRPGSRLSRFGASIYAWHPMRICPKITSWSHGWRPSGMLAPQGPPLVAVCVMAVLEAKRCSKLSVFPWGAPCT